MNFFKKIFSTRNSESKKEVSQVNSIFDDDIPADEQFAIKFNENGGKFIYCTSDFEVQGVFRNILKEIGVDVKISYSNGSLKSIFEEYDSLFTSNIQDSNVYLTDCEYLITTLGGIMLSSNQLKQKKTEELPEIFIVFAKTSQMVKDITEGMRGINFKYTKRKPTGLVTLRSFKEDRNQNDIMNYGGTYKKTYLILLEDL
ncbi:LUD domain-containing protein [Capnocytophaga cynodegmi]|uniref:LUD domain-containing protein n=1 Tax=Capnocytophaga cynodegmi TaxID=28189 RepID=UPI00385C1096